MAPTLGDALAQIFGGAPPPGTQAGAPGATPGVTPPSATPGATPGATSPAAAALIAKANAQYAAAQASLRRGDLATYAHQIQALGKTLAQLKAARP
jgi:uncharacterized membrane protein (UPF0182 family)